MNPRIAFIGGGNMGRAIIGGLVRRGHSPMQLVVFDPSTETVDALRHDFGIQIAANSGLAIAQADVIVFAVKPQQMRAVTTELAPALPKPRPLVISIAAGINTASLSTWLGHGLPIVRAMPNTPALIGRGAAGLYATFDASASARAQAEDLLRAVGNVVWVESESLLDTVTALSGSGPAYFFLFLEYLERAAIRLGLPDDAARQLAVDTAAGAAELARSSTLELAELRRQVTSKGGTTEQALNVLMNGEFEQLVQAAINAAARRAAELSAEFGGR
jgi:pyrroline-5-carboxylate reductase